MSSVLLMDAQSAMAGIFDQICGEDESIREKGLEYISTSLVQMRHKLFIPHPENEKFLVEMIKKVNNNYYAFCIFNNFGVTKCFFRVTTFTKSVNHS